MGYIERAAAFDYSGSAGHNAITMRKFVYALEKLTNHKKMLINIDHVYVRLHHFNRIKARVNLYRPVVIPIDIFTF
ncbi:MAG: hypothetical protein ACOY46_03335 [Bacillota bacterium]